MNFLKVIEKARESCKNSNHPILDHFVDVNKSIPVPKGGERKIEDIILTRYACYLIAQNGDLQQHTENPLQPFQSRESFLL